jgi:hypothetical protein
MPYEWGEWPRYVSVAERRDNGARHAARLRKQGRVLHPVATKGRGRALAATFWGRAWCDNLAAYASLANRLDRGRTYLRGGMVIDLQISPGTVTALVSGSDIYEIAVRIKPMPAARWKAVVKACAGKIDSVVELLFRLRRVAHADLVARATAGLTRAAPAGRSGRAEIAPDRLSAVFGIELEPAPAPRRRPRARNAAHAEGAAGS